MQAVRVFGLAKLQSSFSRRVSSLVEVKYETIAGKRAQYNVAVVQLNNPPVNSLSRSLLSDLNVTLKNISSSDHHIHGLVIASNVKNSFSAGLQLEELVNTDRNKLSQYWSLIQDCWHTLFTSQIPTVAAIDGHCLAGGVIIAVATDYRIASNGDFGIGVTAARIGVIAPPLFQDNIKHIIGSRQTELMLLQGKVFTPDEALKIGLIDEVHCSNEDIISYACRSLIPFMETDVRARTNMKLSLRSKIIQKMELEREEHNEAFADFMLSPPVQEKLVSFIKTLKKQ
ncbi:PREDICTED: enoyl-CoA delta isomerase 1, mitochondrial-like [Amphimedon queenslandica]|uniref:Enoyl-CoA hydratase n=1 Tax=Amphimedon queenslandica TaxID=400682 RepID=A0A1X7VS61_AMPQE|nr:PREDICTED: enoyl-CoA delta isomerase 1, mitochondrial-like [Amphimedon queenslandica]|eukprot:XP_019855939.1 PREDICTED: enoyl-CoA delta isomerase 1, mitochondrial-like [Amphimedon queenslandica]